MELYLIRHLPTEWNEEGRLQGRKDIMPKEIDQKLINNVEKIKKDLNKATINQCFSSPLKRAVKTAEIFGCKNPIIDKRVIEFNFGEYEGKAKKEMLSDIGPIWFDDVRKLKLGESFSAFTARINSFISEIEHLSGALVFSHGFVIRYVISKYLNNDVSKVNYIKVKTNHLYRVKV